MRVFLDPHGCAKNQVDAEQILANLIAEGFDVVEESDCADLVIVNSCGFIESAKKESIEAVLGWRQLYPDKKIMLAGCLAQRYANELSGELAEADFFFGNADLSRSVEAVRLALQGSSRILLPEINDSLSPQALLSTDSSLCSPVRPLLSLPGSAYLKISEGCDNRCSYCAIPLIRGPLRSRPKDSVLSEAQSLLSRGLRELCLVGQDLAGYGSDRGETGALVDLLEGLLALEGDAWIRLLYIHPDHFPLELLDIISRQYRDGVLPQSGIRILPYFDIPFQHASAPILRAMGRRGDSDTYLSLIRTIRERLPDATIRSTFLLGFPGESQEDLDCLLAFQEAARLDWLGAFSWSREEDTLAYQLKGRVSAKTADSRRRLVEETQQAISMERMARFASRDLEILIEERVEGEEGLWLGRAPCQAPDIDGSTVISSFEELPLGGLVPCHIHRVNGFDLDAIPLATQASNSAPGGRGNAGKGH